jgi:hypothetical protein
MFDGTLRESHNSSVQVTEHPVEFGANITDNAIVLPREVQLDIMVGDIYVSFSTPSQYNLSKRSSDALSELNRVLVNRIPVVVICNLAQYSNLMLININANQDKGSASTLVATLFFREILVVDNNAGNIVLNNNNSQYQNIRQSGTKQLVADTP